MAEYFKVTSYILLFVITRCLSKQFFFAKIFSNTCIDITLYTFVKTCSKHKQTTVTV